MSDNKAYQHIFVHWRLNLYLRNDTTRTKVNKTTKSKTTNYNKFEFIMNLTQFFMVFHFSAECQRNVKWNQHKENMCVCVIWLLILYESKMVTPSAQLELDIMTICRIKFNSKWFWIHSTAFPPHLSPQNFYFSHSTKRNIYIEAHLEIWMKSFTPFV